MARRTKDEAEKTRGAILDAAEKVFLKRGVVRTSLQEIAVAAGVTRGAVYWHFKNKMELVQAMADRVILPQEYLLQQLEEGNSTSPLTDLKKICCESLRQMIHDHQKRRVFTILTQRCEYVEEMAEIIKNRRELRDRIMGRFIRLFERAGKQNMLKLEWQPRIAALALHSLMFGLMFGLVADKHDSSAAYKAQEKASIACITAFFKAVSAGN